MSYLVEQPPYCDLLRLSLSTRGFGLCGKTRVLRHCVLVDGVGRFHSVLGEFGRLTGDLVLVTCNVGLCSWCSVGRWVEHFVLDVSSIASWT